MDTGPFVYIVIIVYHLLSLFTFLQTITFYHSIRLILCLQQISEIDNLTVSWDKVLGCAVCRFHVAAGAKLCPGRSINLGFILREDLLLCSSYLPLGVPNWADLYTPSCSTDGDQRSAAPCRSPLLPVGSVGDTSSASIKEAVLGFHLVLS
jgi:hypothetical protein